MTTKYHFPPSFRRSRPNFAQGRSGKSVGMRGSLLLIRVSAHNGQSATIFLTSESRFGHHIEVRARALLLEMPKWEA